MRRAALKQRISRHRDDLAVAVGNLRRLLRAHGRDAQSRHRPIHVQPVHHRQIVVGRQRRLHPGAAGNRLQRARAPNADEAARRLSDPSRRPAQRRAVPFGPRVHNRRAVGQLPVPFISRLRHQRRPYLAQRCGIAQPVPELRGHLRADAVAAAEAHRSAALVHSHLVHDEHAAGRVLAAAAHKKLRRRAQQRSVPAQRPAQVPLPVVVGQLQLIFRAEHVPRQQRAVRALAHRKGNHIFALRPDRRSRGKRQFRPSAQIALRRAHFLVHPRPPFPIFPESRLKSTAPTSPQPFSLLKRSVRQAIVPS